MLSHDDVKKLAELARIDIRDKQIEELLPELSSVLSYVSEVQEVAAKQDAEEPDHGHLVNINLRSDEDPHASEAYTEELLAEAPEREENYVKVRKVL